MRTPAQREAERRRKAAQRAKARAAGTYVRPPDPPNRRLLALVSLVDPWDYAHPDSEVRTAP